MKGRRRACGARWHFRPDRSSTTTKLFVICAI